MGKIIINGGNKLTGTVQVEGAKNAVLPIIAATILGSRKETVLENVPELADVHIMHELLENLGAEVTYHNKKLTIDASCTLQTEAPFEFVTKMRASVLVLGPLLARYGHAHVAMPGGCAIGSRPIDLHLKGFEAMGATYTVGRGFVEVKCDGRLQGGHIYLDMASVGATENIMMAASLAEGTTTIENAAKEPEIEDLAHFINAMGGKVTGAGTSTIKIEGVEALTGANHTVIPDRIEAGTFIVASALTGGGVTVLGARLNDLRAVVLKLKDMGVTVEEVPGGLKVCPVEHLQATDIKTLPHPGFPTDMQSQMMVLMLRASGASVVTETVFENRFMHVDEFRRMNASMKIEGRSVIIDGANKLKGAEVKATDLRAGAALVIAGLIAQGVTTVTNLYHIDRGYVNFVEKLQMLGANIHRVQEAPVQTAQELNV